MKQLIMAIRASLLLGVVLGVGGCAEPDTDPEQQQPLSDPAAGTVHEYAYLEDEVERLLGFLRGGADLRTDVLEDSVTFYLAPEGGGDRSRVPAAALRDRSSWRVGSYSLIPPETYTHRSMTPGLHWNCQPMNLDARYTDLAEWPHVGVRLAPDAEASCLQTWNATFVFNEDPESPRLIGVVYDQWEW